MNDVLVPLPIVIPLFSAALAVIFGRSRIAQRVIALTALAGVTGVSIRTMVSATSVILPRTRSSTKCCMSDVSRSPSSVNRKASSFVSSCWRTTSASAFSVMLKPWKGSVQKSV